MKKRSSSAKGHFKPRWWLLWLGAGFLAGGAEIIFNACFLDFPVVLEAASASPGIAIIANVLIYLSGYVAAALILGALAELIRKLFPGDFPIHSLLAVFLLVAGVVYLIYGAAAGRLENLAPSTGLPENLRFPIAWWWVVVGAAAALLCAIFLVASGFIRTGRKFWRWLGIITIFVVLFNVLDHKMSQDFPRWWLAAFVLLALALVGIILEAYRVSPRRLVGNILFLTLLAIVILGVYFGWPGKNYDGHLFLMIWDAQRPDRMSVYGYERDTTPVLSGWKDHLVRFERAYSPANYTFASHVSIFTGLYLREHHLYNGTEEDRRQYRNFENLSEVMKQKGYYPILLTENPWLLQLRKGFRQVFNCPTRREAPLIFLPFYRSSFLFQQLLDHIIFCCEGSFKRTVVNLEDRFLSALLIKARRRGPYFLCLNWMYAHSRYYPGYARLPGVHLKDLPLGIYDPGTRYMDFRLGKWIEMLKKSGQFEHSLFIITSDHGDFLGEFGLRGHGKTLLEPVLKVPLLLFGFPVKTEVIAQPVPLVALKKAIEALAPPASGGKWNIPVFIREMVNNRGMVVEGSYDFKGPDDSIRWFLAIWEGRYKYMQDCHEYIRGGSEGLDLRSFRFLYDLQSDPRERINLTGERPEVVSLMEDLLSEWESRIKSVPLPPPREDELGEYPPGLVEQLRALGYMR